MTLRSGGLAVLRAALANQTKGWLPEQAGGRAGGLVGRKLVPGAWVEQRHVDCALAPWHSVYRHGRWTQPSGHARAGVCRARPPSAHLTTVPCPLVRAMCACLLVLCAVVQMGGRSKMPPGGRSSGIFHDDAPSTSSPSSRSGSAHQRTVRGPSSAAHSHAGATGGVFPNDVAMLNRPAPQAQAGHRGQGGSGGYGNVFQNDNQMAQRSTPQGGQQRQQQVRPSPTPCLTPTAAPLVTV